MENPASKIQIEAKNTYIAEGDTVRLLLHGGEVAVVDSADFPMIAPLRWSPDGNGYSQTRLLRDGKIVYPRLHRFLFGAAAQGWNVDHENGCRWDCRRSNLRLCTHAENNRNRAKNSANRIGFKGVRRHKGRETYFVQIKTGGQTFRVGEFHTPEEAARGYDFLAQKFFGVHARLNFPSDRGENAGPMMRIPMFSGERRKQLIDVSLVHLEQNVIGCKFLR